MAHLCIWLYTAKTQYRKFETNMYSQQRNFAVSVPISTHVSMSDLYFPKIGLPILLLEIGGPILGIYKSLETHKCRNWDWGREILFLGIHKWDFRCSVVYTEKLALLPHIHSKTPTPTSSAISSFLLQTQSCKLIFVLWGRLLGPRLAVYLLLEKLLFADMPQV